MGHWLFKTEPDTFSVDDLAAMAEQTVHWDGVRNYQARNFLRDEVKKGDQVFIYHSSCKEVGIVGWAEVVREGYVDHSQFDPLSQYYDAKSSIAKPRWYMVDVRLKQKFAQRLSLPQIKQMAEIQQLGIVKKAHRLSIMPVPEREWQILLQRLL